jgi:hypothetical protein
VSEATIFPQLSKALMDRLTRQAVEQDDRVAAATLFALAQRPVTFKVKLWPRALGAGEREFGGN